MKPKYRVKSGSVDGTHMSALSSDKAVNGVMETFEARIVADIAL